MGNRKEQNAEQINRLTESETISWEFERIRSTTNPRHHLDRQLHPVESSITLPPPASIPTSIRNVNCPLSLCTDLEAESDADLCPNALQCCLLVMPWPLPLRSLQFEPDLEDFTAQHPAQGLVCTPIAQTPQEYLDYLWQQYEQGEQLPPAVVKVWEERDRFKFDPDLIEDWWYLLLDAIVSEGYGGLCWLDEADEPSASND